MREYFNVSSSCNFFSEEIAEGVKGLFGPYGGSFWNAFDNVIVTVCNTDILCNVDGVENVRSGGWYRNLEFGNAIFVDECGGTKLDLVT